MLVWLCTNVAWRQCRLGSPGSLGRHQKKECRSAGGFPPWSRAPTFASDSGFWRIARGESSCSMNGKFRTAWRAISLRSSNLGTRTRYRQRLSLTRWASSVFRVQSDYSRSSIAASMKWFNAARHSSISSPSVPLSSDMRNEIRCGRRSDLCCAAASHLPLNGSNNSTSNLWKIADIPRHHRKPMNASRGGDHRILEQRLRLPVLEARPFPKSRHVHRQDTVAVDDTAEPGFQFPTLSPCPVRASSRYRPEFLRP